MKKIQTLAEFLGTEDAYSAPLDETREEMSVKDFCRGILTSREYRQSIRDRIALGNLSPAVELRLYDYAYGKPPDKVEHTGKDGQPIETITEVRRVVVRVPDGSQMKSEAEVIH